ncbi:MAG TPA: hypothetical protein VK578_18545 [Edaphobacter sp.]|nr:hypothetical protein [Edaphobacter sp.]
MGHEPLQAPHPLPTPPPPARRTLVALAIFAIGTTKYIGLDIPTIVRLSPNTFPVTTSPPNSPSPASPSDRLQGRRGYSTLLHGSHPR